MRLILLLIPLLLLGMASEHAVMPQAAGHHWCVREWEIQNQAGGIIPPVGTFRGLVAVHGDLAFVARNDTETRGGRIDLRGDFTNLAGSDLVRWGVFQYTAEQFGPDVLLCVPADVDRPITFAERLSLESAWAGPEPIITTRETFPGVLHEMLTLHSHPDAWSGMMPNKLGHLSLYLGSQQVYTETFVLGVHAASERVIETHQSEYRNVREATLRGDLPPNKHRRYLDALARKYRTSNTEQFIPADLPIETPLPARTIQEESWNCGDNDSLTCDLTWSEVAGDIDIVSSVAEVQGTGSGEAYETDAVTSGDHHVEADVVFSDTTGTSREMAVFGRKACGSATRTWYEFMIDDDASLVKIRERTSGSSVDLSSSFFNPSSSTTYVLRGDISGSDLELFVDAASEDTVTDGTPISNSNFCGGIRGRHNGSGNVTWENFEIDDNLGAGARRRFIVTWPF